MKYTKLESLVVNQNGYIVDKYGANITLNKNTFNII